jgi:subtilisin family serine protease
MSIQVKSDHTGDDLAAMEGVKRVWPVQLVHVPKPQPSKENLAQPFLTNSHRMTGVDYIRETFGNTGKGIKVGIIDTGVDYKHPAFGGCPGKPGPGCRFAFGRDFIGDDYDKTGTAVEDDGMSIEMQGSDQRLQCRLEHASLTSYLSMLPINTDRSHGSMQWSRHPCRWYHRC